ncbi:hypothetical protein BaRGS_00013862 [Batillaria attramentaria]|uniref:CCHC-type domain-containing protein n=1 Tax=Batillaria attramentaria TaxID=370345 RepID=A0ABD0L6M8_9CAEN
MRSSSKCTRCGKGQQHTKEQCPARKAECRKCHKKGHYAAMCFSKASGVYKVEEKEESEDTSFLGAVQGKSDHPWKVSVQIDKKPALQFKLDRRADVTVIPERLVRGQTLKKTHKTFSNLDRTVTCHGHIYSQAHPLTKHRLTSTNFTIANENASPKGQLQTM